MSTQKILQLVYASVGVLMVLSLVGCYLKKHTMPAWMEDTAALCFGVYLLQQFILKGLYDYTFLPTVLDCWLPWISFIIALFGSLVLSWLLRKTDIGRKLIG